MRAPGRNRTGPAPPKLPDSALTTLRCITPDSSERVAITMKAGRPSFTAEGAAGVRAIEALRPARFRVFEDPFACAFLTLRTRWRLWPGIRPLFERLIDRTLPGVLPFTAARTRWMDELLVKIAPDVDQIVILGAGYDTAFARHPELPARLAYFEVDHPSTGAAKKERIARRRDLFDDSFDKVRTVSVDFEREDLLERLVAGGFEPDKATFFVWSGVIPYLERSAVEATLRLIAQTPPGSHVVADLVAASGMRDPGSSRSLRYFKKLGEAIRFMIDPEDFGALIAPFGLQVESILRGKELRDLYFAPDDPRRLTEYAYLIHARIGSRQENRGAPARWGQGGRCAIFTPNVAPGAASARSGRW